MMLRSSGKPPLARSPIRLRPRRKPLQAASAISAARTPPGSLTKSQLPSRSWAAEEHGLRPEYHTISCELKALAKMVHQELGTKGDTSLDDGGVLGGQGSPLFERGIYYDEYCARRNERLKRRKGEVVGSEKKPAYDLGVRVESAKKRGEASSKLDSRRKAAVAAAAATPVAERRETRTPRYSLRSTSKENKKPPPIPVSATYLEKAVGITERKVTRTRRA